MPGKLTKTKKFFGSAWTHVGLLKPLLQLWYRDYTTELRWYIERPKADKHFQEYSESITGVTKILLQIYHWDFGSMLISMADVDMCVKEHYDLSYGVQIDMKLHTESIVHHI